MINETEPFWLKDVSVLYRKPFNIIPYKSISFQEKLNAITLFSIYLIFLILIFNRENKLIYLPLGIICLMILLNYIHDNDLNKREKDFIEKMDILDDTLNNPSQTNKTDDLTKIESGFYDFTGKLVIDEGKKNYHKICKKPVFDIHDFEEYRKGVGRKPKNENPFMNPYITDYNVEDVPIPSNSDDDDINEEIQRTFNKNLYRDIEDTWEFENSQRQFYTIPSTSIPNQQDFAEWLYKVPSVCKQNQEACLRYEDIRYKR